MKAPWFPFYTGDFLASSDVQLMEAHEVGAYILLMAHSWQSDMPGYLPNDEGRLRRLAKLSADQWKESAALLLSKWPVAEDAALRVNPRLKKEADKQVELRELKAEAGRKSAERRAAMATERQQKGNTNPTCVENPATGVGQKGNYSQPQSQPHTSNEVGREPAAELPLPLPAKEENKAVPVSAPRRTEASDDDQSAEESPLAKPMAFQAILKGLYPTIDYDYYRNKMLVKAPEGKLAVRSWRNWIVEFMERELKDARKEGKELITPATAPDHNDVPTNAPAAVPMGIARIEEPVLNTAFVGQQQAARQAQSMARLQGLATSTAKTF